MKFDFCIGNPPYQAADNNLRLYPSMYLSGQQIADCVEMIFPNNWREVKTTNGLSVMNNEKVKRDKQIVVIQDLHNVFAGVAGAEWTNIIIWKSNYDNNLDGSQLVIDEEGNESIQKLPITKDDVNKPEEILSIVEKVEALNEDKIINLVSSRKPYGFESDILDNPEKYNKTLFDTDSTGLVKICGKKTGEGRTSRYIDRKQLPRETPLLDKYKLFVVKAWGNMDEKSGFLGGSYSELICAKPLDCCSEMYLEVGPFENEKETENACKYFNTKFFRAVFYKRKLSQNTAKDTYADVPIQNFTTDSDIDWSKSIHEIDEQLYKKYILTDKEIDFIEKHIKEMNV